MNTTLFDWSCSFNYVQCTEKDFEWIFNEKYGNCFQFKPQNRSLMSSNKNGLSMDLFVGVDRNLDLPQLKKGVFVSIDSNKKNPTSDFNNVFEIWLVI